MSLVGPSEKRTLQPIYNWLKILTFQTKFGKKHFSYQNSPPLYDIMQKEVENFQFLQVENFDL